MGFFSHAFFGERDCLDPSSMPFVDSDYLVRDAIIMTRQEDGHQFHAPTFCAIDYSGSGWHEHHSHQHHALLISIFCNDMAVLPATNKQSSCSVGFGNLVDNDDCACCLTIVMPSHGEKHIPCLVSHHDHFSNTPKIQILSVGWRSTSCLLPLAMTPKLFTHPSLLVQLLTTTWTGTTMGRLLPSSSSLLLLPTILAITDVLLLTGCVTPSWCLFALHHGRSC
jgi:hypothetical protein